MAWHREVSVTEEAAAPALGVPGRPASFAWLGNFVWENGPLLIGCACFASALFVFFGSQVMSDSWLNVLGGREILQHGLPHHDELAIVSHGRPWIDQQWLSNIAFYALYSAGGMSLAARVNVVLTVLLVGLIFAYGRRQGATRLSVMLCCIPVFLFALQFLRAQVLVQPLFVGLVALLAAESRRPSRRVLLAFPVLALWANLHGSVVVAASLVALLGAIELWRALPERKWSAVARSAALLLAPWGFIFASPYGLELTKYYGATIRSSDLPAFLSEWAPASFSNLGGKLFFLSAAFAIVLIARRPRALTPFEIGVLALTAAGGLHASRSIPWFAFAAGMLLPRLLDEERGTNRANERGAGNRRLAVIGVTAAFGLALYGLVHPVNTLATEWPQRGPALVEQVLRSDPNARVLASYDLADWLLLEAPITRGRIAFDGRWEILSHEQLRSVRYFLAESTDHWADLGRGYRLLVLGPKYVPHLIRTWEQRPGVRVLYRTPQIVVLDRGRAADRRP